MGIARTWAAGISALALTAGMIVAVPAAAQAAVGMTPRVLINEVYGGGGNSGAALTNDFIELYNASGAAVNLSTWSVQYASATGTGWATTPLTGTLPAGSYYLINEANGTGGTVTPDADVTGTLAMSATAGKVALVSSATALTCGANCNADPAVVDFVGFGTTANDAAGGHPAPAPSNTNSVSRNSTHANTANNAADFTAGAPTPTACGTACAPSAPPTDRGDKTIAEIQGTSDTSPFTGDIVTTKGVVTAVYPTGGFNGYYIQTPGTGGAIDLATHSASDGLFVYSSGTNTVDSVVIGDYLQVKGTVSEFNGLTQLTPAAASDVTKLTEAHADVSPATVAWPRTDAQRESLESMLVQPQGPYTITNTYSTNQYGSIGLASGTTPLIQWTDQAMPNSTGAQDIKDDNAARAVVLDDGSSTNFLSAGNSSQTPPYVSNDKPVRVGEAVTFTKPVIVDYRNKSWNFQPTSQVTPADAAAYPATWTDTRTTAPNAATIDKIGTADIRVASFNVLNFFTMTGEKYIDAGGSCTSYKDRQGNPITVNTCSKAGASGPRGAWDQTNFQRQYDKTVAAISGLDADVVGLMEVENSIVLGEAKDATVSFLVEKLNVKAGSDVWAFVPSSTDLPPASEMDVINCAIIYKKAAVDPVGASHALGTLSAAGQAFDNAREPIAQVFKAKAAGSEPFLFVVNHFKSKGSGSGPGNVDNGDGQGASNADRVAQATALVGWLDGLKKSTGVDAVVTLGDYNSYGQEDPMQILYGAGYVDAEHEFDLGKYSYSFSGLSGSLDHVLLNAAALGRATGADIWNINSGESIALEYSRYNYSGTNFYRADPYASSDHDPVVVGLKNASPSAADRTVQILGINDFHGRISANGQEAGAAVLAGAVNELRADNPNTVFSAAGDLIGASTFESFIAHDKPTIDALNAAGLEVSAVGNHEFDQGYNDLMDRVIAPYNATTNPYGGAEWKYLGANVKVKASSNAKALDPTWVKTMDNGVKVGFIGAVTEHLDELVSPAGIADLEITDIPTAVNAEADLLKSEGVDIVVLLVHEGAATTALSSATDPASDFGKIVNGVDDNVDAIISGHTHLTYNHMIPVPGWAGRPVTERPVVSAGQYGYNLDQLLFTVNGAGTVTGITSNTLALTKQVPDPHDATKKIWVPNYDADGAVGAIVSAAVANAAVLGAVPLGKIAGPFNRAKLANGTENRGGESTLGNLVAEAQRWATEGPIPGGGGSAQIAVMNPGGLRTDMVGVPGDYPKDVTYKQAAEVQPFANTLVNMQLTGAQLKTVLEQQWQPAGASRPFLKLGISEGFTYTYDPAAAAGDHITRMLLNGAPIDPSTSYSVTANSFLAAGGDNFTELANGTNKKDTGQTDLQGMVDYLAAKAKTTPLPVDYTQRAVGIHFPAGAPAEYKPGAQVSFGLSSLAFSTAADLKDSQVAVTFDGASVGQFPVDNTVGSDPYDEIGTAAVAFAVPTGAKPGAHTVTITGTTTGTVALVAITLVAPPSTAVQCTGSGTPATCTIANGTVKAGGRVTVKLSKFRPWTLVLATFDSRPYLVGLGLTWFDGTATMGFSVPKSTPPGQHRIWFIANRGQVISAVITVT